MNYTSLHGKPVSNQNGESGRYLLADYKFHNVHFLQKLHFILPFPVLNVFATLLLS